MSRIEVRPFEESDLATAAALLAERHRRHRLAEPLLSPRFEDRSVATAELMPALQAEHASGAIATRDGKPVGFLLGAPKPGEVWGPNVWVESAGQATSEPEAMRDMYALAAARWVDEGRTAHYVVVPAHDEDLVRAWFRVGFGQQHSHGIRALPPTPTPPRTSPRLRIRYPIRADIPLLAQLELELPRHQALAPTFSAGAVPLLEECVADWEKDFDDPDFATFVAEYDGQMVGSAVGCTLEKSGMHRGPAQPDNAAFLGFAAVFPHARGVGAGRALGEAVLGWAAENQFSCCVTDWRTTNLLSSRAWAALGFTESFVRLHRLIGY
jgi:GNAT superfamily N-acetyltransferase